MKYRYVMFFQNDKIINIVEIIQTTEDDSAVKGKEIFPKKSEKEIFYPLYKSKYIYEFYHNKYKIIDRIFKQSTSHL